MSLLLTLITSNAIMHGIVVSRFGIRNNNQPFLMFAIVYAALGIAVYLSVPYALWMVLLLAVIGILGLSITFNKPVRAKTLDKIIWLLDATVVLYTAYMLFAA